MQDLDGGEPLSGAFGVGWSEDRPDLGWRPFRRALGMCDRMLFRNRTAEEGAMRRRPIDTEPIAALRPVAASDEQ